MIQKPTPISTRAVSATSGTRPEPPTPPLRERVVKRHTAVCPWGDACSFNARKPRSAHSTVVAAEVEAVRHIRATHKNDLTAQIAVMRRAKVQREIVSEEIIEG